MKIKSLYFEIFCDVLICFFFETVFVLLCLLYKTYRMIRYNMIFNICMIACMRGYRLVLESTKNIACSEICWMFCFLFFANCSLKNDSCLLSILLNTRFTSPSSKKHVYISIPISISKPNFDYAKS